MDIYVCIFASFFPRSKTCEELEGKIKGCCGLRRQRCKDKKKKKNRKITYTFKTPRERARNTYSHFLCFVLLSFCQVSLNSKIYSCLRKLEDNCSCVFLYVHKFLFLFIQGVRRCIQSLMSRACLLVRSSFFFVSMGQTLLCRVATDSSREIHRNTRSSGVILDWDEKIICARVFVFARRKKGHKVTV